MNALDTAALRTLAENAEKVTREYFHDLKVLDVEEIDDFALALNPSVVLRLLEEWERMRECLQMYSDSLNYKEGKVAVNVCGDDCPIGCGEHVWYRKTKSRTLPDGTAARLCLASLSGKGTK